MKFRNFKQSRSLWPDVILEEGTLRIDISIGSNVTSGACIEALKAAELRCQEDLSRKLSR